MPRLPATLITMIVAAALASGCGEEGASEGATLTVYVSAPLRGAEADAGRRLCEEARAQAARGEGAGGFQLRVLCLDAAGSGGSWTLAKVAGNARRATEDSTTVAYVGEPDAAARRQSRPILDAAEIAELGGLSGRQAVTQVLAALREDDSDDPRRAVFQALG